LWIELQRLVFCWFCQKKVPAEAGAFFCVLMGVFAGCFRKRCVFLWCFCGALAVNTAVVGGELGGLGGPAENMPVLGNIFSTFYLYVLMCCL